MTHGTEANFPDARCSCWCCGRGDCRGSRRRGRAVGVRQSRWHPMSHRHSRTRRGVRCDSGWAGGFGGIGRCQRCDPGRARGFSGTRRGLWCDSGWAGGFGGTGRCQRCDPRWAQRLGGARGSYGLYPLRRLRFGRVAAGGPPSGVRRSAGGSFPSTAARIALSISHPMAWVASSPSSFHAPTNRS